MKSPKTKTTPRKRGAARHVLHATINPDWFYRVHEAGPFFGFSNSVLHVKIQTGEIPKPIALSDGGRARGWFGRTIIAWQAEREAKVAPKLVVCPPKKKVAS
jgi:predicted DNA-binding transcriptional regulator AlpA